MVSHLSRMIYVDDSGHPASGTVVYGWVEFAPDHWASVLRNWLDGRKKLVRDFGVPVVQELHTTDYVHGRGRISTRIPDRHVHNGVDYWKDFGREVATVCLETLRCTEGLQVGAVWRSGPPELLAQTRQEAYAALVQRIEGELVESDSLAIIFMDGNGTDPSYRSAHRSLKLAHRRVIEDVVHLDSGNSQLIQMADLVAWCANVHIDRHSRNEFAWDWYDTYLSERDSCRGPRQI